MLKPVCKLKSDSDSAYKSLISTVCFALRLIRRFRFGLCTLFLTYMIFEISFLSKLGTPLGPKSDCIRVYGEN